MRLSSPKHFRLLENPNQPEAGSRTYTNLWTFQTRYQVHVQSFTPVGSPISWPPTNMMLVAEEPKRT